MGGANKTKTQVGAFRVVGKDGQLEEHDYSWTEQANVLFIDRYLELILNGDDGCAYNNDYGDDDGSQRPLPQSCWSWLELHRGRRGLLTFLPGDRNTFYVHLRRQC